MVRLGEFVHRKPAQMSGGQQQRVALARAMAPRPKGASCSTKPALRPRSQAAAGDAQRAESGFSGKTGITFIFVTHDQEEALSMSDRIAVMSAGEVDSRSAARRRSTNTRRTAFVAISSARRT